MGLSFACVIRLQSAGFNQPPGPACKSIEEGYDSQREIYTMTVPTVLELLDVVVAEAKAEGSMPTLPVLA